jgi:hypothetical protein
VEAIPPKEDMDSGCVVVGDGAVGEAIGELDGQAINTKQSSLNSIVRWRGVLFQDRKIEEGLIGKGKEDEAELSVKGKSAVRDRTTLCFESWIEINKSPRRAPRG